MTDSNADIVHKILMAQLVTLLPCKHEDLASICSVHVESQAWCLASQHQGGVEK